MLQLTGAGIPVLPSGTQLIVVAGGDGTLRKTVASLVGCRLPLALLPCGTANNVAYSMGLDAPAPLEDLIARWRSMRRIRLDIGIAMGPWGERYFVESAGVGLVAEAIAAMDGDAPHPETGDRAAMLAKAQQRFRDLLAERSACRYRVTIGGRSEERDLLLFEMLNIHRIGPALRLGPLADSNDGLLDVLAVGEAQRCELERCLDGRGAEMRLHPERARTVAIAQCGLIHLDDWTGDAGGATIAVRVERSAVDLVV